MSLRQLVVSIACCGALFYSAQSAQAVGMDTYGLNEHFDWYPDYNAACDETITSGVKWVRIAPAWSDLQPNSGSGGYDLNKLTALDAIINRLTAGGVSISFVLAFTPEWAANYPSGETKTWVYPPTDMTDWENYVSYITHRYKGKIFHWEVWNEQDSSAFWKGSVGQYVTLLQKASLKIKATDANNKVLLGGLTGAGVGNGAFLDQMKTAAPTGVDPYALFDIINYHCYQDSSNWINVYRNMAVVSGKWGFNNKKIWITESGYSTVGDTAKEVVKADYVDQVHLLPGTLPNVERVFWYQHRNIVAKAPPNGNLTEENFGLITDTRTPLKAFYYFQAANGAETDFKLHKAYPSQTTSQRTLYYDSASSVVDYAADGSTKRIPSGQTMGLWIKDAWLHNTNGGLDNRIQVDVTYLDSGTGTWRLEYDGLSNPYTPLPITKTNSGAWMTKTFILDDGKFANRQTSGHDLQLVADSADLVVSKVAVRKEMSKARIVLGATDRFRFMERAIENNAANEGYSPAATLGGKECRKIPGNGQFTFLRVSDALLRSAHPNITFTLEFWDSGTDLLTVFYDGVGGTKSSVIAKTNTGTWRSVTRTLTDASFNNTQHYNADIRIGNGSDGSVEYISQFEVGATP